MTENDGQGNSVSETIAETANYVTVLMASHDGATDQALIAYELTQGTMDGYLADGVLSNGSLSGNFEVLAGGNLHILNY